MTLEELNRTCDRLEAAQACRNLVGTLSYYDSAFRTKDLLALWDHSDEATLILPEGSTWTGYDQVAAALLRAWGDRSEPGMDIAMRGVLRIHNVNSDLLEINDRCDRAQGVWYSPGLETDLFDPANPTARPDKRDTAALEASADYVWRVYRVSFVKRADTWKIQRLEIKTVFDTPFDTPWSACENTLWTPAGVTPEL